MHMQDGKQPITTSLWSEPYTLNPPVMREPAKESSAKSAPSRVSMPQDTCNNQLLI